MWVLWTAGREGRAFLPPQRAPPPKLQQVGAALAAEVMAAWQARLSSTSVGSRR